MGSHGCAPDSHTKFTFVQVLPGYALYCDGPFCAGCKSDKKTDSGAIDFRLNLSNPEVQGREVNVNGGVAVPVERIQWEWGDGQMERHRFFPVTHTYAQPGKYQIIVTVFDDKERTASQSITVEIK